MIVDPSAILAIAKQEADARVFAEALQAATEVRMSAASYVELGAVADPHGLGAGVDRLLELYEVEIAPLTREQAVVAREALRRFRSGRLGLNFGDAFSYALHKTSGEPLLFKGRDFARTDVVSALSAS